MHNDRTTKLARQRFTGGRIRQVREEMQWTQEEMGRRLGVGNKAVSEIERGNNSVDAHVLYRIARESGYEMEFFVNPSYAPRMPTAPRTRADWEAMYPGNPRKARMMWELDQLLERDA